MRTLNWQIKGICHQNRERSYATQNQRSRMLQRMATQLYELGYRHVEVRTLKPKHVDALLELWRAQGISDDTIANRLAALRWLLKKVGRESIMVADNQYYGLTPKKPYTDVNKAKLLPLTVLEQIKDPHVKMSLRLQAAFGLRREESVKFIPATADRTDHDVPHIWLKPSWCKGGRNRIVPITSEMQLEVLQAAYELVGRGAKSSLIPSHKTFKQQRDRYDYECRRVGLSAMHGLRHAYAHRRYRDLTGYDAPVLGGEAPRDLDRRARGIITEELGHGRLEIVASYVGRVPAESN
jgi:integrase